MKRLIKQFLADERGATAIEYALIGAGISVAIVTAVTALGTSLDAKYKTITDSVK